jgi:taurine dioxygenase
MARIVPSGQTLGATVEDVDLAQPLSGADFRSILAALGEYGVLRFPQQSPSPQQLIEFGRQFGQLEVHMSNFFHEPGLPEMMILSNMQTQDGKPLGFVDAGQGWHTDQSYSSLIALANVLHGIVVPVRDGRPLGGTQFRNMHAAYADLPADIKRRLEGVTARHDYAKFWDMMRTKEGSKRPPLTEKQRSTKPPVSHPIVMTHPITLRPVLYANPGYAVSIDGWSKQESDQMLEYLFQHQDRPEYLYTHHWTQGDVLMWENIGTTHNAVADYGPDEHRYMRRLQAMATEDYQALLRGAHSRAATKSS